MSFYEKYSIQPGIYRIHFNHNHGVPALRDATYDDFDITKITQKIIQEDLIKSGLSEIITGNESPILNGVFPKRTYFSTIENFIKTWKRGYELGVSQFGYNDVYEKLGFELFYVNWDKNSEFFKFGEYSGIVYWR